MDVTLIVPTHSFQHGRVSHLPPSLRQCKHMHSTLPAGASFSVVRCVCECSQVPKTHAQHAQHAQQPQRCTMSCTFSLLPHVIRQLACMYDKACPRKHVCIKTIALAVSGVHCIHVHTKQIESASVLVSATVAAPGRGLGVGDAAPFRVMLTVLMIAHEPPCKCCGCFYKE